MVKKDLICEFCGNYVDKLYKLAVEPVPDIFFEVCKKCKDENTLETLIEVKED